MFITMLHQSAYIVGFHYLIIAVMYKADLNKSLLCTLFTIIVSIIEMKTHT